MEAARDQLGHADTAITAKHYVECAHKGPAAAAVLDAFFAENSE